MSQRVIKLEGRALEIAREIEGVRSSANLKIEALGAEGRAIRDAGIEKISDLMLQLKREIGLGDGECCHVDGGYLDEFGLAFAKTACQDEGLDSLVEQLGLRGRRRETSSSGLN